MLNSCEYNIEQDLLGHILLDGLLLSHRYTESLVCKMNVAIFSSSCMLHRVWCVAGLLLATRFFLLSAEAGISTAYVGDRAEGG